MAVAIIQLDSPGFGILLDQNSWNVSSAAIPAANRTITVLLSSTVLPQSKEGAGVRPIRALLSQLQVCRFESNKQGQLDRFR